MGGKPFFVQVEDQLVDKMMIVQEVNIDEMLEKVACNIINTFSDVENVLCWAKGTGTDCETVIETSLVKAIVM